jgi:hypothetical protein
MPCDFRRPGSRRDIPDWTHMSPGAPLMGRASEYTRRCAWPDQTGRGPRNAVRCGRGPGEGGRARPGRRVLAGEGQLGGLERVLEVARLARADDRGGTFIKSVAGLSWRGSRRTDRGRGTRGVNEEHPSNRSGPWDPCPSGDDDVRSSWVLVAVVRCSCCRPHRAGDHEFTPAGCRRQDTRTAVVVRRTGTNFPSRCDRWRQRGCSRED